MFSNPDSQPAPDPNSGTDTAPGPDGGAPAPDTNGGGVTASGAPPVSASGLIIDWDAIENIKADWRQMRDDNIRARGMTLMACVMLRPYSYKTEMGTNRWNCQSTGRRG